MYKLRDKYLLKKFVRSSLRRKQILVEHFEVEKGIADTVEPRRSYLELPAISTFFLCPLYFYWLRVKNSNHLHTDTKFYLENKASFIHISSVASFEPFLIAGILHFFGQFRG